MGVWIVLVCAALAVLAFVVLRQQSRAAPGRVATSRPMPAAHPVAAPPPPDAMQPVEPVAEVDWATALVEEAGLSNDGNAAPFEPAVTDALARLAADPKRLPRRPHLLPQLMSALADERTTSRRLADLLAQDPVLAGHVLRLSNSAMVRVRSEPVDSLERAVTLVGTQGIRQVITVALMQPVVRLDGGTLGPLPVLVWDHTQASAARAAAMGPRHGADPLTAQLLALLHGVGALMVVQVLREHPAPAASHTAECLRQWSPRLAAAVARQWDLGAQLTGALEPNSRSPLATVLAQAMATAVPAGGACAA